MEVLYHQLLKDARFFERWNTAIKRTTLNRTGAPKVSLVTRIFDKKPLLMGKEEHRNSRSPNIMVTAYHSVVCF